MSGAGHRARTVAAVVAVVVSATAVLVVRAEPVYRATTEVLVDHAATGGTATVDPARALRNQRRVADSPGVREAARERLGLSDIRATVVAAEHEDVLIFTGEARTGEQAVRVAEAYAAAYLEARRVSTAATPGDGDRAGDRVVRAAVVPGSPASPRPTRALGAAAVIGALAGLAVDALRRAGRRTVRSVGDLAAATGGAPDLARIPAARRRPSATGVASATEPDSTTAEGFRRLRTALAARSLDRDRRTLRIAGSGTGDGATTVTANLAVALARAGELVVVVDADPDRPRLHQLFGTGGTAGLGHVLAGSARLSDVVRPVRGEDFELFLVPSGRLSPGAGGTAHAAERPERLAEVLATLRADADVVLVDGGPLDGGSASAELCRSVDGTVLVARAGRSDHRDVSRAAAEVTRSGGPLVGTVLLDAGSRTLTDLRIPRPRLPRPPAVAWRRLPILRGLALRTR